MVRTDYIPQVMERLDAARVYIEDFKRKSDIFFDSKPYRIISEEELQESQKIIRFRFKVLREVPTELHRPVTACISSELRPILDNLVWGMSQIVGARHSCGIKFPIYVTEFPPVTQPRARAFDTWVRGNKILSKFPTGAVDLIRQLQPFNTDNRGQTGTSHILYILNRLANQHKHKIPLHVTGVNQNAEFIISGTGALDTVLHNFRIGNILEDNSIIQKITVPASQPAQDFEPKVATHIAFDKSGVTSGAPVYKFLIYIHNFIRDEVIAKFEPFFPI